MQIVAATRPDSEQAVHCLAAAFADDPITRYLLQSGPKYPESLKRFFSLLLRARIAIRMPVLLATDKSSILGAAMGNTTAPPPWPSVLEDEWGKLDSAFPGFNDRAAKYDELSQKYTPSPPHYYLGVIGTDPVMQGRGIGTQLLRSFCELSAADSLSCGVYLETANPSNVTFYERAGFAVAGQGSLGAETLWCMFRPHRSHPDA